MITTVSELGERGLLARIRERLPRVSANVVLGAGDDAAVVEAPRNTQTVLTTDALVEGVHFDPRWSAPSDVGHKALAVNLSDLAAMGATPRWALLALALPPRLEVAVVDGLLEGLVGLACQTGVAVVGGNLTSTPGPLTIDVTAVGTVPRRRVLTRAGGRPGDELYVSGTIGAGAAGLEMLRAGADGDGADGRCIDRYRRPTPRVRLGLGLGRARAARAAMDLSDGLADALTQLAEASGCGAEIDAGALPIDEAARAWWTARNVDPIEAALTGGDDYELLFAVPRGWRGRLRHVSTRVADPGFTRIGTLTKSRGRLLLLRDGASGALPAGYQHFR